MGRSAGSTFLQTVLNALVPPHGWFEALPIASISGIPQSDSEVVACDIVEIEAHDHV